QGDIALDEVLQSVEGIHRQAYPPRVRVKRGDGEARTIPHEKARGPETQRPDAVRPARRDLPARPSSTPHPGAPARPGTACMPGQRRPSSGKEPTTTGRASARRRAPETSMKQSRETV